jgi:hypothetical protein
MEHGAGLRSHRQQPLQSYSVPLPPFPIVPPAALATPASIAVSVGPVLRVHGAAAGPPAGSIAGGKRHLPLRLKRHLRTKK